MNKLAILPGGMPLTVEDLGFMQEAVAEALRGIAALCATDDYPNYLLHGAEISSIDLGGGNLQHAVQAGYCIINGEPAYIPPHTVSGPASYQVFFALVETPTRSKVFYDNVSRSTALVRRAMLHVSDTLPENYIFPGDPDAIDNLAHRLGTDDNESMVVVLDKTVNGNQFLTGTMNVYRQGKVVHVNGQFSTMAQVGGDVYFEVPWPAAKRTYAPLAGYQHGYDMHGKIIIEENSTDVKVWYGASVSSDWVFNFTYITA
jgi:hypothetical protein